MSAAADTGGRRSLSGPHLDGYLSEVSIDAGDGLEVMLSLAGAEADAEIVVPLEVVRLTQGALTAGSGNCAREPADARISDGAPRVTHRPLGKGSYLRVEGGIDPEGPFTLAVWAQPTAPPNGWHVLAASWNSADELLMGLFVGGSGVVTGAIRSEGRLRWCTAFEDSVVGSWSHVALVRDAAGGLAVHQHGPSGHAVARREAPGAPVDPGSALLTFGAAPRAAGHDAHFNGKLGAPTLIGEAVSEEDLVRVADGDTEGLAVLGRWDLSRSVDGPEVIDVSGGGRDGVAVNAPTRAVTGPRWDGVTTVLYSERPELYDAVHLHDDDLDDPGWPVSATVEIAPDAAPGIYAVTCGGPGPELRIPFTVRSRRRPAKLGFLIPTLTWQAYNSNRAAFSFAEDGILDELPCVYDLHSDGSIVYICSRRRPTRSLDPGLAPHDWGAHSVSADLATITWLDRLGIDYDVLGDEQLHADGIEALSDFRCLLLGSHPEYFTRSMQTAFRGWLDDGGRVMYLGGNGMFWITSIDDRRPHLIEVRKALPGDHSLGVVGAGESEHSFDGEIGGLWERQGLPPRSALGVDTAGYAFGRSEVPPGYARTDASRDRAYEFVFEGVDEDPIGAYGANLGTAAGCEMDRERPWPWREGEHVVLARAEHPDFIGPDRPAIPVAPGADIALTRHAGGGAAFAAGAITWSGSLAHDDYDNGVARISENVLRRFLEREMGEDVLDDD